MTLPLLLVPYAGAGAGTEPKAGAAGPLRSSAAPAAVPGELIVRFEPGVGRPEQRSVLSTENVSLRQRLLLPRTVVVRVPKGESVAEAVAALEQRDDVAWAEPNTIQHVYATTPSDSRFGELWALDNTGQTVNGTTGTADADIDAPEAWDEQTGSSDVVVAVIDTGTSFAHPDLAGQIWSNPGETGGGKATNGIDDDGNGKVDDYRGWDFVNGDNFPIDGNEHGTHVSGTIGAVGDNSTGIAGINWNVSIMPVQVCDRTGSCPTDAIVNGIAYAGANGADVANMSLGGSVYSQAERDAIAAYPDTLFVVAAGNDGLDLSYNSSYPCEFPLDNIVCVAASTQTDAMADFSNYGAQSVDLAAPGENILSTVPAYDTKFIDNFEGAANWDYTDGSPEDARWERTTESYVSPTHSITDSAGADYKNNADAIVTLTNPFSLVGQSECRVEYETNIITESGWDGLLVKAATSASGPWTGLGSWSGSSAGRYVTLDSDLSGFSGESSVYLRFELVSDYSYYYDGVHIDDVRVLCPAKVSSSYTGSEYAFLDGTSMATPHVTGAAALLQAKEPKATPGRLKAALLASVDPLPAFAETTVSGGRLNLAAALAAIDTTPEPAPTSQAALDPSFGTGGRVTTSFGTTDDRAFAIAEQSDGKLVVVGRSGAGGAGVFAVARYNADGSLDGDFGSGGVVTTAVGDSTSSSAYDEAHAVAIQSDGKIVVAGLATSSSTWENFAVVRYNSDGSLDSGFGTGGIATANNNWDEAWAVALQSDGKIVVAGKTGAIPDAMIVRFNTNGSLDSTFGAGGQVITTFGSDSLKYHEFRALAVQANGKIVAAGYSEVGSDRYFALARYNGDGSLDTDFDGDGKVTTDMDPGVIVTSSDGTGSGANALLIQSDGKIVAAGGGFANLRFALARYNADGSLDTSLAGDGTLLTDLSPATAGSRAYALAVDGDGKLVAAGIAHDRLAGGSTDDFAVARFQADGSADASFNGDGSVTTPIGLYGGQDIARGLVLDSDGSIVVAGQSEVSTPSDSSLDWDFSLARYVPDADAGAPAPPVLLRTSPASPGSTTAPELKLSAESASTATLYATFDCSGDPVTSASAAEFLAGVSVTVPDNDTTTFSATTTDAAGNVSACSTETISYTADSIAPEAAIEGASTTYDQTPTFTFSANEDATFQCRVDTDDFEACASPYTAATQSDGAHTFEVSATDLAGNESPTAASHSFTVLPAPDTSIDSGPSGPTNHPTFTFSSTTIGTSFECRVVGVTAFAACTSPYTAASVPQGARTFEVRAVIESRADPTPAGRSFTFDSVAPNTTILTGPSGPWRYTAATFTFSASESGSTFQCKLDAGAYTGCGSSKTYTGLSNGTHVVYVKATDLAGNTDATPAACSFRVDTVAPNTTITAGPPAITTNTRPSFGFSSSETGSSFRCRLDAGAYAACTSPKAYGPLANGAHTFYVKATDAAGNTDGSPASRSFRIDTVPPDTTITAGPGGATRYATHTFYFRSSESGRFECRLDGAAWAACVSPKTYARLANGTHTFRVRAIDAAGNVDGTPAIRSFRVDTIVPNTTIAAGPSGTTTSHSATFRFTATEAGSTFRCKLDGSAWSACASPRLYTGLRAGSHTFYVRAIDSAGNVDPTPALRSWRIV